VPPAYPASAVVSGVEVAGYAERRISHLMPRRDVIVDPERDHVRGPDKALWSNSGTSNACTAGKLSR
jgi:hypothetical protein